MLDIHHLRTHPEIMESRIDSLEEAMSAYAFSRAASLDVQSAASATKVLFMGVFLVAGGDARAFTGGYLAAHTMLSHVAENPMVPREVAAVYQQALTIMTGDEAS